MGVIVIGDANSNLSVARSPKQSGMYSRPLLIWDGDCAFCRICVDNLRTLTSGYIGCAPFQEIANQCREVTKEEFESRVHLIEKDGKIVSGARAVFGALAAAPGRGWLLWLYLWMPGFALVSERLYCFVGSHRSVLHRLSAFLLGQRNDQRN